MRSDNMHAQDSQQFVSMPVDDPRENDAPVNRPSEADRLRLEERQARRTPHGTHCSGAR